MSLHNFSKISTKTVDMKKGKNLCNEKRLDVSLWPVNEWGRFFTQNKAYGNIPGEKGIWRDIQSFFFFLVNSVIVNHLPLPQFQYSPKLMSGFRMHPNTQHTKTEQNKKQKQRPSIQYWPLVLWCDIFLASKDKS